MPERAPLLWVICIRELYVSVICIVDVNDSPVASVNHKALQLLLFLCKHSLVDADCSCSTYLLFSDWISCLTVAWHVIASIDQVFLHPNAVGRRRRGTRSTWPDRINFRRLTEWPLSCVDPLMVLSVLNSLEELALASAGSFVLFLTAQWIGSSISTFWHPDPSLSAQFCNANSQSHVLKSDIGALLASDMSASCWATVFSPASFQLLLSMSLGIGCRRRFADDSVGTRLLPPPPPPSSWTWHQKPSKLALSGGGDAWDARVILNLYVYSCWASFTRITGILFNENCLLLFNS